MCSVSLNGYNKPAMWNNEKNKLNILHLQDRLTFNNLSDSINLDTHKSIRAAFYKV